MLTLTYMKRKENMKAYLFLLPSLALAATFLFYPLMKAFASSFLTISQSGKILGFAGFKNYAKLFSDSGFKNAALNTIKFIIFFVPLNTALTLLAATLTRKKRKGTTIAEFIFASPIVISLSAYALIFKEMFRGRISIINRIFSSEINWLSDKVPAMFVLVFLGVFLDFGLDYLLLTSAFRSTDKNIIDAAKIDGADDRKIYFSIELPLIKRMLSATIFLALKDAIMISSPVIILTEGGPFRSTETIMFYYYIEAFKSGNRAVQNTLSVLMTLIFILSMAIYSRRRSGNEKRT